MAGNQESKKKMETIERNVMLAESRLSIIEFRLWTQLKRLQTL
jgi:hypothetical protein